MAIALTTAAKPFWGGGRWRWRWTATDSETGRSVSNVACITAPADTPPKQAAWDAVFAHVLERVATPALTASDEPPVTLSIDAADYHKAADKGAYLKALLEAERPDLKEVGP